MTNASATLHPTAHAAHDAKPKLDHKMHPAMLIGFTGLVAAGLLYTVYSLYADVSDSGTPARTVLPFILLGIALLVALGFEFVNGFHDNRECGGHRDLHPLLAAAFCRGLVGSL